MTTDTDTPLVVQAADPEPSGLNRFLRFLGRLVLAFLKLIPVFIIIAALVAAAWLGFQELNRSFGVVNDRIDWYDGQVAEVRDEIATVSSDLSEQQAQQRALETEAAQLDSRVSALDDDLTRQGELLNTLEEQAAALENSTGANAENITALGDGLNTLQRDVTANGAQIDDLGGQIDSLDLELNTAQEGIADNAAALAQKEAIVGQLSKTLTLFRIWEMVARARLHLVDQNAGLAQDDVERAQAILEQMVADETGDLAEALGQVQTRLDLAAAALPDDPDAAIRDLNTAWESLDAVLTALLEQVSEAEIAPEGEG
jgi:chromosome segregation ATPase